MAEVGAMCSSRHSCAIVEDDGLSASHTIAHEVRKMSFLYLIRRAQKFSDGGACSRYAS